MERDKLVERERAICQIKESFERVLSRRLNLIKVSSPLALLDGRGFNDDLSGVERAVSFPIKALGEERAVVVHSLAKWKRVKIKALKLRVGEGIVADMKALRPDEEYTNLHSIYVDQWDWEQRIAPDERGVEKLKECAGEIFNTLKEVERECLKSGRIKSEILPKKLKFIHSEELLQLYPTLEPKERERAITQREGAIFIIGIGGRLSNGVAHDLRAADYDDWSSSNGEGYVGLNGDLLVWHPTLKCALELSSMGIRVDSEALERQLSEANCCERRELSYHKMVLEGKLPQTIGGGIGESRVVMFLLGMRHIGEAQVGVWSDTERAKLEREGVWLL